MREQQAKTLSAFTNTVSPLAESLTTLNDYTNKLIKPLQSVKVDIPKWLTEFETPNYFQPTNYFASPTPTYYPGLLDSPVVQAPVRTDDTIIIERVVSRITKEVADEVMLRIEMRVTKTLSNTYPIYDAEAAALVVTGNYAGTI